MNEDEKECTCESYSEAQPGRRFEPDPDCPEHGPTIRLNLAFGGRPGRPTFRSEDESDDFIFGSRPRGARS